MIKWKLIASKLNNGEKYIGIEENVLVNNNWKAIRYVGIVFTRSFKIERNHLYYDGPHDMLHLGFVKLCWSWNWCDGCADTE